MGILTRLKLRKKKEEPLPILPIEAPKPPATSESVNMDNMKAKMDLIITNLESLKVQNETLNERMRNVEKTLAQILLLAKG